MIIAEFGGRAPNLTDPLRVCPAKRSPFVSLGEPLGANPQPTAAAVRPPAALWDALLAAGGPAAALALLGRIDRGEDWRRPAAGPSATTGSSWDAAQGPDTTAAHHLGEWVTGSAVHPALAAANLATLQGAPALEALAGDRLEQLGGWAQQYATGPVARLLRPLEPIAAAGGWWCSGLDPLADWAPMGWGCFKPDRPRIESRDGKGPRARKYEHPIATPARSFWLRVPAAVAQLVADRFAVVLPAAVAADGDGSAGAFWRWWAQTPALPLLLTEGAKKAAALLSAGVPAVALPGIWNGAPKNPDGRPTLLPELAAVPLKGRPVSVLFDYSDSERARRDVAAASRRLGRLLERAGAGPVLLGVCPGPHKGADDALAAGVSFEQLAAQLEPLAAAAAVPVVPYLRRPDRIAPAGQWLGVACPIPTAADARLVALSAPMGSGKTEAIAAALAPLLAVGVRVVLISHRRSLCAALADRLGLPWGEDAAPDSDLRQQGVALCVDSLCPGSGLRISPGDWRGCVVVVDEVCAVLAHALNGTGTAIATRRPAVLETLAALLAGASQVIAADAQLSEPVLQALEAATGADALLIASEHRPATGRRLVMHPTRDSWRAELVAQLQARRRLWIATTAAKPGAANAAQNLGLLTLQHWPTARVLVVDADTVADENHDAARLAGDPDGIAAAYDVVIASPAVAAGLSVTLRGWFDAVMVAAGGTTDPDAVAQASARVRDDCPRHLYCPERSPGNHLTTGSGDTDPAQLLRRLGEHEAATVTQLVAAGADLERGTVGPWLPLWARLGAARNGQRLAYRSTVRALLEREGYDATEAAPLVGDAVAVADAASDALKAIATEAQTAADAAVIAAEPLTAAEARELARKRKRSPTERAQLARHRVAEAWGLGADAPTPELLEADREGLSRRARMGWILRNVEARQLVAQHDQTAAAALAPDRRPWAPDLCREAIGPKVTAADALALPSWLERGERGEWFTAADAQLVALQITATAHGASLRQVLGVGPGKRAISTLRALLALAGHRLKAKRSREDGARAWRYRVVAEALPDGADPGRLLAAWRDQLGRSPGGT